MIFNDKTLIEMAETRPMTVDAMARINGVGAKKLESYGDAFLEVIAGEVAPMHPARRKLAGRDAGALFDRLAQAQLDLQRGADGTERPLSLSTGALRKIAEMKPRSRADLARVGGLNEARLERFAERFLEIIEESD